MKAISKRQYITVLTALKQLQELHEQGLSCCQTADGFLPQIRTLSEQYSQYETLLVQLANCIAEYEVMQKDVRVNIIAPALRQARKKSDKDFTKSILLKQHLTIAQGGGIKIDINNEKQITINE